MRVLTSEELEFIEAYEEGTHDCHISEEDGCEACERYVELVKHLGPDYKPGN